MRRLIISTGREDRLGALDNLEKLLKTALAGSGAGLDAYDILNSKEVPAKYNALQKQYPGGVGLLFLSLVKLIV